MAERQIIQIPAEQVQKLADIEAIRPDLKGYPLSRKVHILLQERLSEGMKQQSMEVRGEKPAWLEYVRERVPLHIFAPIAFGTVRRSREMIGSPFSHILVATDAEKTWWCNDKKDIDRIGSFLISNLQNPVFAKEYYHQYT